MKRINWERRIARAEDLAARTPAAAEVLNFYRRVLGLQQQIAEGYLAQASPGDSSTNFRDQLDVDYALRWMPATLELMAKHAPSRLAEESQRIGEVDAEAQREMLAKFVKQADDELEAPSCFAARVIWQPCAEVLAAQRPVPAGFAGAKCPVCGAKPQFAVLRPEGDGGKRHLACSFCVSEWEFRRLLCPACGEEEHVKLPRFTPEEPIAVRVEACDTCKHYLKSFDMTVDGLLVPEVDEMATVALDAWAAKQGYRKIQLNLMGF